MEGLAIIFGILKFNQYLHKKKVKLVTDHTSLTAIYLNLDFKKYTNRNCKGQNRVKGVICN